MRLVCKTAFLLLVSIGCRAQCDTLLSESVRVALEHQREVYPASQYRDVYKNFMQDYFGPGHLLNDTVAAGKYLRYELENSKCLEGPDFEATGSEGNFYRLNLRLIKDGTIHYDVFFDAFVRSVQGIVPPDGSRWMKLWGKIDAEIQAMGWRFENEAKDRADLAEQFAQGNYIAHHSKAFNEANNFHYRIISREIFNDEIRPLLGDSSGQ